MEGTGITRGGTPIRIYASDGGGDYPVIGAWLDDADQRWIPHAWSDMGYVINPSEQRLLDIVQVNKVGAGDVD